MHRCLPLFALLALLTGCSVGDTAGGYTLRIPISNGGTAPVDIRKGVVINAENAQVRIEKTVFDISVMSYDFSLREKQGAAPRRVVVEDVTDDQPVGLVDDAQPTLKKGLWEGHSRKFEYDDPLLRWMMEIDGSIRVYRFTLTQADGSSLVMYEPEIYSVVIKDFIRSKIVPAAPAPPVPVRRR